MPMRSWIYWGVATLMLATIVHLAMVLFAPVFDVGRRMAQFETAAPLNSLRKIDAISSAGDILVEPSPDISYAFCRFDVSNGPLKIEAQVPPSYWSVSVYSDTGDNIYTINDAQAGVERLRLLIVKAAGLGEADQATPHPEQNTLRFTSPAKSGLIIFRGFVPDKSMRGIVDNALSSAQCEPVEQTESS